LRDETGAAADDLVRAYTAARDVFGLRGLWAEIEALDGRVAAATQVAMLLRARVLLERTTRWLLRNRSRPLEIAATVAHFAPGAAALADALPKLQDQADVEDTRRNAAELESAGVPAALADRVAHLEALVPTFDIVEIAASTGLDVAAVAEVSFALGSQLDLHWLRDRIIDLPRETRWQAMARAALRDDVYAEQAALTAEVIQAGSGPQAGTDEVDTWIARNRNAVERCMQVLADIRAGSSPDMTRLSVAVREIRNLTQSSATRETTVAPEQPPARAPTAERVPRATSS
jgi:glutamate dehydrogenase